MTSDGSSRRMKPAVLIAASVVAVAVTAIAVMAVVRTAPDPRSAAIDLAYADSPLEAEYARLAARAVDSEELGATDAARMGALQACLGSSTVEGVLDRMQVDAASLLDQAFRVSAITTAAVAVNVVADEGCWQAQPRGAADGQVPCRGDESEPELTLVYAPGSGRTLVQAGAEVQMLVQAVSADAGSSPSLSATAWILFVGNRSYFERTQALPWAEPGRSAHPAVIHLAESHGGLVPPDELVNDVIGTLTEGSLRSLEPDELDELMGSLPKTPKVVVSHGSGSAVVEQVAERQSAWDSTGVRFVSLGPALDASLTPGSAALRISTDPTIVSGSAGSEPSADMLAPGGDSTDWHSFREGVARGIGPTTPVGRIFVDDFENNDNPVSLARDLQAALMDDSRAGPTRAFTSALRLTQMALLPSGSVIDGYVQPGSMARIRTVDSIAAATQSIVCPRDVTERVEPSTEPLPSGGLRSQSSDSSGTLWSTTVGAGDDRLVVDIRSEDGDCGVDAVLMLIDDQDRNVVAGSDWWLGDDACKPLGPFVVDPGQYRIAVVPIERDPGLGSAEYTIAAWIYASSEMAALELGAEVKSSLDSPLASETWIADLAEGDRLEVTMGHLSSVDCGVTSLAINLMPDGAGTTASLSPVPVEQTCNKSVVHFDVETGGRYQLTIGPVEAPPTEGFTYTLTASILESPG